jgi:hypothetical protein
MYSCDCRVSILEADDLDAGLLDHRERFTAEGTENSRRTQRQGLGDGVKIPSLGTERGRLGHPAWPFARAQHDREKGSSSRGRGIGRTTTGIP